MLKIEETKEGNVETAPVPEVKATKEEKPAEVTADEAAAATGTVPEGGAEVPPENTEEEKKPSEATQEEANPAPEVEDGATTETEAAAEEGEAEEQQPEIKVLLWSFLCCDCLLFFFF